MAWEGRDTPGGAGYPAGRLSLEWWQGWKEYWTDDHAVYYVMKAKKHSQVCRCLGRR